MKDTRLMKDGRGVNHLPGFLLSLAGAILIMICFFLPWLKVKVVVKSMYLSGLELGQESTILWMVPLLALLVGSISFIGIRTKKINLNRVLLIAFSSIGTLFILVILFSISKEMNSGIKKITGYKFQNGIWGTLLGFIIGILGAFFIKPKKMAKIK